MNTRLVIVLSTLLAFPLVACGGSPPSGDPSPVLASHIDGEGGAAPIATDAPVLPPDAARAFDDAGVPLGTDAEPTAADAASPSPLTDAGPSSADAGAIYTIVEVLVPDASYGSVVCTDPKAPDVCHINTSATHPASWYCTNLSLDAYNCGGCGTRCNLLEDGGPIPTESGKTTRCQLVPVSANGTTYNNPSCTTAPP